MEAKQKPQVVKVSGPLVVADNMQDSKLFDVVRVGKDKLIGEIIKIEGSEAYIQVYEETSGVGPGNAIENTGSSLSVELGPGLLGSIYDGIQRPLDAILEAAGTPFLARGVDVRALQKDKKWNFKAVVEEGDFVSEGDVLGEVKETNTIVHKIMAPPGISGKVKNIESGNFTIDEVVAVLQEKDGKEKKIAMAQKWPIRIPRPVAKKMKPSVPLITGRRIVDTFFPIVKGGAGCTPGPFGSGKTVIQQGIAKWCDAEVIVYIGCGERGNEMTDILMEFPELTDPKTKEPLMKRTVIVANTSNMPVAAREASIYTGVTIAEYFRDMGYNVALMADSTSRWAEALREMGGRLEEMPGEEGYPAYLGSKTASFYERSGYVKTLGSDGREGSLTVIGAVSPPGGDLSEPVTQNTLRTTKVFWGLDASLAAKRHYPAINWLSSYSLYADDVKDYLSKNIDKNFSNLRKEALSILQAEASLDEIVKLVGAEALSEKDQLILETAKILREDFLQQNAFDEIDDYTSLRKQFLMLSAIMSFYYSAMEALARGVALVDVKSIPSKGQIARAKMTLEKDLDKLVELEKAIKEEINSLK